MPRVNMVGQAMIYAVTMILCCSVVVWAQGSAAVADKDCLECHEGMDKTLSASSHQLSSDKACRTVEVRCVSCHDGADKHLQDPSKENITNPARLSGHDMVAACTRCHTAHTALDNYGFDAHASQQLSCAECHKVHGGAPGQLLDTKADFCLRCHQTIKNKLIARSSHPIMQGVITCLNCHRFTKRGNARRTFSALP